MPTHQPKKRPATPHHLDQRGRAGSCSWAALQAQGSDACG
jgi:hypothetical protein